MLRQITPACALALVATTSACSLTESNTASTSAKGDRRVTVSSSDSACELSSTKAPSGRIAFTVKNTGSKVTEFYVYDKAGTTIVAEVENVGPGLSRELVLTAKPGTYVTACKPGMSGKGIRADFTVTDSGKKVTLEGVDEAEIDEATSAYKTYVQKQSATLLASTTRFSALYTAGRDRAARELYPTAREPWERIEPVAESFGDLDPKMDLREADLEQGQEWTGWHRIEKDLWPTPGTKALTPAERRTYADDLLANTKDLHERIATLDFTLDQIGNGSKGLLDEVASTKITGEEELFSHTDLYDIQANVDGAKAGFEAVEDLLKTKDAEVYEQIEDSFGKLQAVLDPFRTAGGDAFVSYERVTPAQRKELSDAVNALAEPLSKVTGILTQ